MPSHGGRSGRDTLDALLQRIDDLERQVQHLNAGHRISLDRGDTDAFAVDEGAFEGQVMIQYDTEAPWYFSNGEWRPFTNTTGLDHAEGRYQISGGGSVTIASGTAATIDWAHISGDALLDLSVPSAPTPVLGGWFRVDATYASTSSGWTVGSRRQARIEFHGLQQKHSLDTVVIGAQNLPSGGDNADTSQGYVGLEGHLRSTGGDYIALILSNLDSGSHDLTLDTIEVSRVYASAT